MQAQSDFFLVWWSHTRKLIPKPWRHSFDTLVVLICWLLWKERNDKTFDRRVRTVQEVIVRVNDEITAWAQAGFRHLEMFVALLVASPGREIMAV